MSSYSCLIFSETFGLSNYASWEVRSQMWGPSGGLIKISIVVQVAEIVGICKAKDYVQPKIYQAMYKAITRAIEPVSFSEEWANKIGLS
jgi:aflatoxin B1 aldehyde reductase